jgi:sugar/nucleoside kinase (ribokinase family)
MGGAEGIAKLINGTHLFGMENWTLLPLMSDIWQGLIDEVFPLMPDASGADKPLAFFDLADPEKRTKEDILRAMSLIGRFESKFRAILGLNEKELYEIAAVYDIPVDESLPSAEKLRVTVTAVYGRLGIYCLVVHPTKSACCVIGGEYYSVDGPYCAKPVLTTGAGDNFNAGFCLGQALGLTPKDALLLGVSTSGYYVRNAHSPGFEDVIKFVDEWDAGKLE